jgi:HK97 family phage major capsid protein
MSTAYLRTRMEERAGLSDASTGIYDRAAAENRDVTSDEQAQLDTWETRSNALDSEIARLETAQRGAQKFQTLVGRLDGLDEADERQAARRREERPPETRKSIGQQFIESTEFKEYRGWGSMAPIQFEGFLEERSAITLDTLGEILRPQWVSGPADPAVLTPLLNVIGRVPVSQNSVSYIRWGMPPEAGGPIAEGEVKPEAEIELETVDATLGTYAHWKPITRQALEDFTQIRGIVEGQLRRGLARRLERAAGETLAAATVATRQEANLLDGVRNAIAALQSIGLTPNAVGVNPFDYAAMDIAAANASNSGPARFGSFWGLGQTVPIPSLPRGQAYVGDFATAVAWFDRNTTAVYMSDSHDDFFVRNKLAILAEQRATFDVVDPSALVKVVAAPVDGGDGGGGGGGDSEPASASRARK